MPGVYTYGKVAFDETGARTIKPVTKIRGGDAKKYAAKVNANQWLIENVLAAWRKPFDPRKPETFPRIVAGYQKYITVGNALASRARWKRLPARATASAVLVSARRWIRRSTTHLADALDFAGKLADQADAVLGLLVGCTWTPRLTSEEEGALCWFRVIGVGRLVAAQESEAAHERAAAFGM